MDEQEQQRQILSAVNAADIPLAELWMAYYGLGGQRSEEELDAFLHGRAGLPAAERQVLVQAVNEKRNTSSWSTQGPNTLGRDSGCEAPDYWTACQEESFSALGAAGRSFLSPERAEAERIQSLRKTQLMDSPPEERFDRIVRDAREYFGVSSASVSLIAEDRQYLKSVIGPIGQNTPREIALCNETIRRNSMCVINDTKTDPSFCSNPLVLGEPFMRFYAGYPLHGPGGWNIGTFCIIDQKPRSLSARRRHALQEYARQVQNEIDDRTAPHAPDWPERTKWLPAE
jgi:hypothetical protein